MKRIISSILIVTLMFAILSIFGCTTKLIEDDAVNNLKIDTKQYDLNTIDYELTESMQKNSNEVNLSLYPITDFSVFEEVSATIKLNKILPTAKPYYYAIVDWGDGTWSYNGPYMNSVDKRSTPKLTHVYRVSGQFDVKAACVDLSLGTLYGWTDTQTYNIVGQKPDAGIINNLKCIYSTADNTTNDIESILDGQASTFFRTGAATDVDDGQFIGLLFDDFYRLNNLEVQIPAQEESFPSNIAVEYTTDGGKTWQSLPKYYYLYDYSVGRYSPIMKFPNPLGATLSLPLDGIVANGIRLSAKLFLAEPRTLAVSEMRVYGDKQLLLYTNKGGTFDGDLNNFWTIFGTAETEPIVSGSIAGESTNQSPFRTGMAMIASTEWAQWNGEKLNWSSNEEAKSAYLNQLLNIRCGSDGWSNDNGYVFATSDSPKHLGEQNHYTYNSIFIMAVRDYLLLGNNQLVLENDKYVDFLKSKNKQGQSMTERLEKAMSYMLNTLDGKSGVLTINDPANDGTTDGNASNYWDVHRSFGFKSAYENALFYGALNAMAEIKEHLGLTSEKDYYLSLAAKCKEEYNKLFWNEQKGRYITSVNAKGERLDFGMTYVNFLATAYGVATPERSKLIYEWLDGKRIINGDTSKGKDIYGEYIYAPRSNTLDVASTGAPYYWWDHGGNLPCTEGTFGGFGHQMQNGGTIFYISHYDMLGRLNYGDTEGAYRRFSTIMTEFHKDSLRRNRYMTFTQNGYQGSGEYSEGVIGEFPESGLVPLTFINGFLGINPTSSGLQIKPNLPKDLKFAGIREYNFGNRIYSISAVKNLTQPRIEFDGVKYLVQIPAEKTYVITYDNRLILK